jgi:hypothetical protein
MMLLPSIALAAAIFAQEPFDTDDPLDAEFHTGVEVTLVPHDSERAPEVLQKKKGPDR